MKKHTILFLAANPLGTDRLALDREARAIQVELERGGCRDCFDFVTRWAVEPLDLLRELRKLRPTVVHFSGHGGEDVASAQLGAHTAGRDVVVDATAQHSGLRGLLFHGHAGGTQIVSATALKEAFGAAGSSVRLVVLNACYSEPEAQILLAQVGCVVGMAGSIHDEAARSFAIGFYGGLGERQSVAAAYKQGCAAISLEGFSGGTPPRLQARHDVNPEQLILTPRRDSYTPFISSVTSTAGDPAFIGREDELTTIENNLAKQRIVVIHGAPGLGKTRLVREYAHAHCDEYPGGTFLVPFDHVPPIELAKLLRDVSQSVYPDESVEDQCRRALRRLAGPSQLG